MPTYDFRAMPEPQDLVAELSLSQGQYSLQNVDRTSALWWRESVDAPASGELGLRLAPGESWVVIGGDKPIWVWSFASGGCRLVVKR